VEWLVVAATGIHDQQLRTVNRYSIIIINHTVYTHIHMT
jgi:hypothetical protein